MKITPIVWISPPAVVCAVALSFNAASLQAAEKETPAEKKARVAAANLAKYDEDRDGKLDRVETAIMRLDQARAAAAKKKSADEKKAAAARKKEEAAKKKSVK